MENSKIVFELGKNGKSVFNFNDEIVDCEYYEYGDDILKVVILEGADISDLFDVLIEELPSVCEIDFIKSEIGDDIVVGFGITKDGNSKTITMKFFIDDVTDENIYGEDDDPKQTKKWSPYEYLRVVEKVISRRQDTLVLSELTYDDMAYSMIIGCVIENKLNVKDVFLEGKKVMDAALREAENILIRFDNHEFEIPKISLKIPDELRASIRQYLLFFEEFVLQAKGKRLCINVFKTEQGLDLEVLPTLEVSFSEIDTWLNEYISFTKQNIESLRVDFEKEVTPLQADLLIADLKNQISHLKNSVEIVNIRVKQLQDENQYLRQLSLLFAQSMRGLGAGKTVERKDIKQLIANNEFKKAIKELKEAFVDNTTIYNDLILIEARFNKRVSRTLNSTISEEEANLELSRIYHAILEISDNLQ